MSDKYYDGNLENWRPMFSSKEACDRFEESMRKLLDELIIEGVFKDEN